MTDRPSLTGASIGARALRRSGIREIVDLVTERGGDIARLEMGEPGFAAPAHVVAAAEEAARGPVRYTQSAGLLALREEIVASLGRRYGLDLSPQRILITQGAAEGISAVFQALLEPGDEVLIPDPAWPNFESMARLRGATVSYYPLRASAGFCPDPAEIDALMTPATKVLILNSPGNPTGAVFPRLVVEQIVRRAAERGVIVVSDEVYDELIFEGEPSNAFPLAPQNVVSVFSFSKTYAMTGWRVGYVVVPEWLSDIVVSVQETLVSCISTVSQLAAVAALTGPQDVVAEMRDSYRARRDAAVAQLAAGGIPVLAPQGAIYQMIPLAPGVDARAAAIELVADGVSFAPGTAFGLAAADQLRMSLAAEESIIERGIERFLAWYRRTEGGAQLGRRS